MEKYLHTANRWMVCSISYYSLAIGISTVRVDFERQRVVTSRWLPIYATLMNIATAISLPFAHHAAVSFTRQLSDNWLLQLADATYVVVHLSTILLTMILRWKRERRIIQTAYEFFALDRSYFTELPPHVHIERQFDKSLFTKAFIMIGQMVTTVFGMLHITTEVSALASIIAVYFTNAKYMLHGIIFQYFVFLWHVCKRFEILNAQLHKMLLEQQVHAANSDNREDRETLRQLYRRATAELHRISQTHWQLTSIVRRLCDNYILQTLAVLITYATHTISFGYFTVLLLDGSLKIVLSRASLILAVASYFMLMTDLYLFYRMCHALTTAHRSTALVLRGFRTLQIINEEFEHCCERFSLQLAQRRLHISIAGIFDLNLQTLLGLWAFIICHTIILMQFDLENRLRQSQAKSP